MHSDNEMVNLRSVTETLLYMVDEDSDGVEEIMQLPTIELVQCKECKHIYTYNCPLYESGYDVRPTDFCSCGERSE